MPDDNQHSPVSDDRSTGRSPVAQGEAKREENVIAFASRERVAEARPANEKEPVRGTADEADRATETAAEPKVWKAKASLEVGDVPQEITERYYSEARGNGCGFYPDAQTKDAAFLDSGNSLSAERTDPNVVSDMLKVAEHRGWASLDVKGTPEFRREVWMQAQERGLDVVGYKPSERDLQELERRQQGRALETGGEVRQRELEGSARDGKADRPSAEKGITGKLVEVGEAPYQGRKDADPSPYLTLALESGQTKTLWGVGLPDAVQRAGAEKGDTVTVKRDGFEQVVKQVMVRDAETGKPLRDKETGKPVYEEKSVDRGMWSVTAEKFLTADKEERKGDPALRGADSQMRVIEGFVNKQFNDQETRDRLIGSARQMVAKGLENGTRYTEANVFDRDRGRRSVEKPVFERQKQPEIQPNRDAKKSQTERQSHGVGDVARTVQERMAQERRGPERERSR